MRTLDSLILDTAELSAADTVVVVADPTGDLTRAACGTAARVVLADPDYARCAAAPGGVEVVGDKLLPEFFAGAGLAGPVAVIGEMPKSLARLDYVARSCSGACAAANAGRVADVRVALGANNKHLSRGMNAVLAESFDEVAASRGRGKFRCLVASGARAVSYEPARTGGRVAIGGVFSGAKPDRGGEALRAALSAEAGRLLDLGCGNGSVLRGRAGAVGTDTDAEAVLTARANGVDATWDDAGSQFPDASFDTVALNPPFHDGTAIDATQVQKLLAAAARLLTDGGELYMVHNSHLRYRGEVERRFEDVEQVSRDSTFTVLRGVRTSRDGRGQRG